MYVDGDNKARSVYLCRVEMSVTGGERSCEWSVSVIIMPYGLLIQHNEEDQLTTLTWISHYGMRSQHDCFVSLAEPHRSRTETPNPRNLSSSISSSHRALFGTLVQGRRMRCVDLQVVQEADRGWKKVSCQARLCTWQLGWTRGKEIH